MFLNPNPTAEIHQTRKYTHGMRVCVYVSACVCLRIQQFCIYSFSSLSYIHSDIFILLYSVLFIFKIGYFLNYSNGSRKKWKHWSSHSLLPMIRYFVVSLTDSNPGQSLKEFSTSGLCTFAYGATQMVIFKIICHSCYKYFK